MPEIFRERLPRHPRLGRHVNLDSRSRAYAVQPGSTVIRSTRHTAHIGILDQGQVGACFPPGTRVRMADGSERPIQDVRLGEFVVTAEGRTGRVTRTLLRDEDAGLVRLKLWGHSHLRATREHPILTARGYVKAIDLRIGDEIAMPKYAASTASSVVVADHVTQASHRVVRGNRWQGLPGRRGLRADAHALPEKIELDENFGRLIGLFLAEGDCDSGKVTWSFHIDETDTLVAELVDRLSAYGVTPHIRPMPAHKGCKVVIHGTAWGRLLSSLCGNGSGLKRLHSDLTSGPQAFLAAVLSGWLAGDGCYRKDGSPEGVSISQDLIMGMYDIAQALGQHPAVLMTKPTLNAGAKTRQPRWTLTMSLDRGRCRQDDTHVWRKVRALEVEDYVGPVYDLTVEGDHSYVAEGIGVHNCTGFAATSCAYHAPYATETSRPWAYAPTAAGALAWYHQNTVEDGYRGTYPPDDTGSDGLTASKVAREAGIVSGYRAALDLDSSLAALMSGPGITGIPWYQSMFDAPSSGLVSVNIRSGLAGGHELCVDEVITADDPANGTGQILVGGPNSWSASWGCSGRWYLTAADWWALRRQDGDVYFWVPATAPAPTPPADPDAVLWAATKGWTSQPHVNGNAKAAKAVKTWATAKGLA